MTNPDQKKSPLIAEFILGLIAGSENQLSLLDNIHEEYLEILNEQGRIIAYIWYWKQTLKSLLLFINNSVFWGTIMIKNYITTAIRTLAKNKLNSFVNIFGLSTAMVCCLLVFLFINNEHSFDEFHENIDRIYFVDVKANYGKGYFINSPTTEISTQISNQFPDIINTVRLKKKQFVLKRGVNSFEMTSLMCEPSFFDIFTFPMLLGDRENALNTKNNIVLSAKTASKLFGDSSPIGEILSLKIKDSFVDFTVSGVVNPIPANSSINFDFLINVGAIYSDKLNSSNLSLATFIQLDKNSSKENLLKKFPETIDKNYSAKSGLKGKHNIHPLSTFHLDDDGYSRVLENKGNLTYEYILIAITLLILLVACFNYTNISIATISTRIKEVGLRKMLGAGKIEISKQFFIESLLICIISLILSLVLTAIFLPNFNSLLSVNLEFNFLSNLWPLLFIFTILLVVAAAAALYPSVTTSKISLLDLFNGRLHFSGKNILSRILIVLQFSISIFLIIFTLFMHRQNNYMLSKEAGYNTEKIIRINMKNATSNIDKNRAIVTSLKNNLKNYNEIKNVTSSTYPLTSDWMYRFGFQLNDGKTDFAFEYNNVDFDFANLFDLKILEGRNFTEENISDLNTGILVNEEFVMAAGLSDPIGKKLSEYCISEGNYFDNLTIIGVLKNFHNSPLSEKIKPSALKINSNDLSNYMYIKFTGSVVNAMDLIENEFKNIVPYIPFEYSFLDDEIKSLYIKEKRWSNIITFASIFAILMACSGLFALTMMVVNKRTKEIGIRKVLGASVSGITKMLNKEFIYILIIANIISWPLDYYFINKFLENYAYRINLDLEVFFFAGLLVVIIALLTVTLNSLKAARTNPVDTIRCE